MDQDEKFDLFDGKRCKITVKLNADESAWLNTMNENEQNWKRKWQETAQEAFPCILAVIWSNACADVDIVIPEGTRTDQLERWMETEVRNINFCYQIIELPLAYLEIIYHKTMSSIT
jgi:hypothetical protein